MERSPCKVFAQPGQFGILEVLEQEDPFEEFPTV